MTLYDRIINKESKISLLGLGYVGMPIAAAFAKRAEVIGFDINQNKIDIYKAGKDPTGEVGDEAIAATTVEFTSDETKLQEASFHIVAVPTPIADDNRPNLTPLREVSRILGRNLKKGSVVVYESTVYPGVTEEICAPILEQESGLSCGTDFKIGYSPERINPGDKVHRLETIIKIVAGMDEETLDTIARVYELVVEAGVYRAESIQVAEAAKIIENCQRDINIAFMNELSAIFDRMSIDTSAVLRAARTKWNFLDFKPGLVGGHCIGVDPYYLTYRAEQMGYNSQIILAGRRINDNMGKYVAEHIIKKMILTGIDVKGARVAILGITFKENCPDTRNSRVLDIIRELLEYGVSPVVTDPLADAKEVKAQYGIELEPLEQIRDVDCLVLAVAHREYQMLTGEQVNQIFKKTPNHKHVIADVKWVFDRDMYEKQEYCYWRL